MRRFASSMRRLLLPFVLAVLPCVGFSASPPPPTSTYYVDFTTGDDADTGLTEALAWKTIAKVNGSSFSAGDSILFKRGETWREQLTVPSSGSAGLPITFGAYGTGADPIINGADIVTGWTADTGTTNYGDSTQGAGTNWYSADYIYMFKFTPTTTGTATSINVYIGATTNSGTIKGALYNDNTGAPGTFNSSTAQVSATANSWNTLTFASPPTLTASTQYWMAVWYSASMNGTKTGTGSNIGVQKNVAYGTWPDPAGTGWANTAYTDYDTYIINNETVANVWKATVTTEPKVVYFDNERGTNRSSKVALVASKDWYWLSNVLYTYSTTDPDTAFTVIEAGARNNCVVIASKNYITVDGLALTKANSSCFGLSGNSSNIIVQNCTASWAYLNGFYSNAGAGEALSTLTFSANTAHHNGISGIDVGRGSNGTVTIVLINGNVLYRNCIIPGTGGVQEGAGIYLRGLGTTTVTVEFNLSYENGWLDSGTWTGGVTGKGIWVDTCGAGIIVRFFATYSNQRAGTMMSAMNGSQVYYGLSFKNNAQATSRGIWFNTTSASYPNQNNICYNTICWGNSIGLANRGYNASTPGMCLNNTFKNNISVDNTSGEAREFQVDYGGENDGSNGSGNVYTYNCFGVEGSGFIEWGASVTKATYDLWETAYGSSTFSVESDPLLTSPATGDFILQPTSPCINAGTDVGLTRDYVGNPVPWGNIISPIINPIRQIIRQIKLTDDKPDIGAYEYPWSDLSR